MNKVAFYGGLLLIIAGIAVWILRPNQPSSQSEIDLFGAKFKFDTPAFAVMVIGLAMMIYSQKFVDYFFYASPEPIKKVACTGEIEANCPGNHDNFYVCGYIPSDEQIAKNICGSRPSEHVRTKTVDGNHCGYSLIEITCK